MKQIKEVKVTDWTQLQQVLFEDCWDDTIGRYRSNYAFRGLSNADYDLKTSLFRLCEGGINLESHIFRNFKKYAEPGMKVSNNLLEWLSIAQHHGLPTRLLDWTWSPYVAVHFATADLKEYEKDGVIWCIDLVKAHERLPKKFMDILSEEESYVFTTEMLRYIRKLEQFSDLEDSILFFEPPSIDSRIVNQYALFSVLADPMRVYNSWIDENPELYKKIIIDKSIKWEVRDKLDQANITERVLFPGLDGLSDWLTRNYTQTKTKTTNGG